MTGAALRHPEFAPRARREPAHRADDRLARGGAHRRRGARRAANLQHLRLDRDLRQLLRDPVRLAARRAAWQGQGPPLPGVTLRIVDPETGARIAGRARPARSKCRGYVTPGYSGASAAHNAAAFTADGYFRTGDLGFVDARGRISISSRATPTSSSAPASTSRRPRSRPCCCSIRLWRRRRWSARPPASAARLSSPLSCRTVGRDRRRGAARALPRARVELQGARPYRAPRRPAGHRNRQTVPPRGSRR